MTKPDYRKALDAAKAESAEILRKRAALDDRLMQLKDTIEALSALLQDAPQKDPWAELLSNVTVKEFGITNSIREALKESPVPLSPVELRNRLMMMGVNLNDYANEMAVIHNTLKRLESQGELVPVRNPAGQTIAYALTKTDDGHPMHMLKRRPRNPMFGGPR